MLLLRLVDALRSKRIPYAIVGGYAVALHGAVRGTVDIDLVLKLSEKYFVAAERALSSIGLQSRLPVSAAEVFRFRREYVENRNLTAWTFVNPSAPSEIVDVILTHDLAEMKTVSKRIRGTAVRLASIDDLIVMKRKSGRPQDVEDIKALERLR